MQKQLAGGWLATTDRAESSYGLPVYVSPQGVAHSIQEAVQALLPVVRKARHHSQHDVARRIGVIDQTIASWEQGKRRPVGLYAAAIERYILAISLAGYESDLREEKA